MLTLVWRSTIFLYHVNVEMSHIQFVQNIGYSESKKLFIYSIMIIWNYIFNLHF